MRTTFTFLLIFLFIGVDLSAQSFEELCSSENTNGTVVDFELFNDTIYATGFFTSICGKSANYMAKWENDSWVPSTFGITDPGHSLRSIDGKLYIARYEESIDSNWVYVYDGNTVEKMGTGIYLTTASGYSELPNIYDIIEYDNKIIACGEFDRVGNEMINGIMQWNGSNWEALGDGLSGSFFGSVIFPHKMMVHDAALYVVGNFINAGGVEANGIAKWENNQWSALGVGFNNTVYDIEVYDNELIVGGAFTASNGTNLDRIAKWDGAAWVSLGFGFTPTSGNDFIFVHTLEDIDGDLYIAGGLKEVTYDDGTKEACGGILRMSINSDLNTFNGGVSGNDIEAIIKSDFQTVLIGGGVFGNGYLGKTSLNTAVTNQWSTENIKAYPNPFSDYIHLESTDELIEYTITNLYGQVIRKGNLEKNAEIMPGLRPGVYFLLIEGVSNKYLQKIVKQ